jgi:hypothetical protein
MAKLYTTRDNDNAPDNGTLAISRRHQEHTTIPHHIGERGTLPTLLVEYATRIAKELGEGSDIAARDTRRHRRSIRRAGLVGG